MDKKNLSAARRKLEQYKQSKSVGSGGSGVVGGGFEGATFTEVNETEQNLDVGATTATPVGPTYFVPPPPLQDIPTFLNSLAEDLTSIHHTDGGENKDIKVLNIDSSNSFPLDFSDPNATSPTVSESHASVIFSPFSSQISQQLNNQVSHHVLTPTPTAPIFDQENPVYDQKQEHINAGQNFPINFFQSTPISQEYNQQVTPSPYEQQDFYYYQPRTSAPLFFNVNGDSITPHQPLPEQRRSPSKELNGDSQCVSHQKFVPISASIDMEDNMADSREGHTAVDADQHQQLHSPVFKVEPCDDNSKQNQLGNPRNVKFNLPDGLRDNISPVTEEHILREMPLQRKSPIPTVRRASASLHDEIQEMQALQRMKSVQDALELQLEELRRDNERLLCRQSELVSQLENNEKNIQELRRERDRSKEDAKKFLQPMNVKINNLYEENQKILKNSNDVGMELRSKLQEKTKLAEDMEQALIIVSKSKMDLAAELDQEREKLKELETQLLNKDRDIAELRTTVAKLEEKQKVEQQKDLIIHQLEDQIRHNQVQSETLQRELRRSNNKIERLLVTTATNLDNDEKASYAGNVPHQHDNHVHGENCHQADPNSHQDHSHDHDHDHEHSHHHDHDHDHSHHHDHDHDHDHHHEHGEMDDHSHLQLDSHHKDHGHDHNHSHPHEGHNHANGHEASAVASRPPQNELVELKRRLHHLEWENSTFRNDLDKLAIEAKEKRTFEEKFYKMSEECQKYRNECQGLEHLVIQLQGENDTIGDYIALYQSQRLALKESSREKDLQLINLAKDRETLLKKMEELSQLLKVLQQQKGVGNMDSNETHQCSHQHDPLKSPTDNDELEGKIRNLLSEISSSTLVENFHPCAVCSGQLMNV